ncbi:hypothetical protein ACFLTP_06470 [Chloroflexota bacterium]
MLSPHVQKQGAMREKPLFWKLRIYMLGQWFLSTRNGKSACSDPEE